MRFPPFRTLIPSCLFLLAAGPGCFLDLASAAATPPGDACFTKEIALNDSTSDGNLAFDGAREYSWDAERGDQIGSLLDEGEAGARRASHATTRMASQRGDQIGSLLDGGEAGARRASHATTRMASQHRLLEIKTRAGFETVGAIFPTFRQQMEYDDLGRRIRSRLYHRINLVEVLVRDDVFVYDGWKLITTLSGQSGDVLQRFAWGLDLSHTIGGAGNVSGLLVFEDPALGQSHFPRFDGNGNVIGLIAATDPVGAPAGTPNAGEVSATYEYDPFGNALGATGHAAARNPFRFSTTYQDPVTGFSYYGYRFYDPGHGRWLNRDPIAEAGGLNLYGFVGNDPVNAVDVLGLEELSILNPEELLEQAEGLMANGPGLNRYGTVDEVMSGVDEAEVASAGLAVAVALEFTPWERVLGFFKGLRRWKTLSKCDTDPNWSNSSLNHNSSVYAAGSGAGGSAVTHLNAHGHTLRDINPLRFSDNCGSCALAFDRTLSGAASTAINTGRIPTTEMAKIFGASWKPLNQTGVTRALTSGGAGSRGIVVSRWKNAKGQWDFHYFNAVNQKGTIRFLDGQTGKAANLGRHEIISFLPTN